MKFPIKDLANKIAKICGFSGEILWEKEKPDGTPRKILDLRKFTEIGWSASIDLDQGLKISYDSFLEDFEKNRLRNY